MKTLKFIVALVLLTLSSSSHAQFANSSIGKKGSSASSIITKDFNNYNRIMFSYSPATIISEYLDESDDEKYPGFRFGWTGGYSVSKKLPFFIETGLNLSYNTYSDIEYVDSYYDEYKIKTRDNLMALYIPINVAYKLSFSNGIYVSPYTGLFFTINVLGKTKVTVSDSEEEETEDANWFDEDDMGKDGTFKRFQMGWQIGTNIGYKALNFNVGYMHTFIPIYSYKNTKIKTKALVVGLGVNF